MQPTIGVVYFDLGKQEYLPHLKRWIARYHESKCKLPFRLTTDAESYHDLPRHIQTEWLLIANPAEYQSVIRRDAIGNAWDYKGALVCSALKRSIGPMLIMDCDTELLKCPANALLAYVGDPISLAMDHAHVAMILANGDRFIERNAGVMWFGGTTHTDICNDYVRTFKHLEANPPKESRQDLLENDTWSLMCHNRMARCLPIELNWPGHFFGPNNDTVIRHLHGGNFEAIEQDTRSKAP